MDTTVLVGCKYSMRNSYCYCAAIYLDIDECSSSDPCEQVCTNSEGSYECSCDPGYSLDDDQHSCNGMVTIVMFLQLIDNHIKTLRHVAIATIEFYSRKLGN